MIYKFFSRRKLLAVLLIWVFLATISQAAYELFEITAVKVTNTAATDVNTTAATQFNNINTTAVINTNSDICTSVSTDGVTCEAGTYMVYVSLYHEGGNSRNSVGVQVTVNGTGTGIMGADGFVSRSNGHDEATTTVSDVVRFTTASKIGFFTQRLAQNGAATAPAGQSIMRIIRLYDDHY
jgi:hypothetical protein